MGHGEHMQIIVRKLKMRSGEEIHCRETVDGRYVCPVCGLAAGGDPPYADSRAVMNGQVVGEPFATGSFDICPCCSTQYGYTDSPHSDETQSVNWKWQQLRRDWLRSVEITAEVKEQLKNLDLDPHEEIRNALGK